MWYAVIRCLLILRPKFFDEVTLIAPSYRGLFRETKDIPKNQKNYQVSMEILVEDAMCVLKHVGIKKLGMKYFYVSFHFHHSCISCLLV